MKGENLGSSPPPPPPSPSLESVSNPPFGFNMSIGYLSIFAVADETTEERKKRETVASCQEATRKKEPKCCSALAV